MRAQAALRILRVVLMRPIIIKKTTEILKKVQSRVAKVRRILLIMKD